VKRSGSSAARAAAILVATALPAAAQQVPHGIVTLETLGGDGVSGRAALDLAQMFDDGGTRRLMPVLGVGAFQNVVDLATVKDLDLAIVQQDALDLARRHNLDPAIDRMTYVARLYDEDLHIVAHKGVTGLAALSGKVVDFGPEGGGAAVTGPAVFAAAGVPVVPAHDPPELALARLARGEIGAMVLIGAPPVPLLATLEPGSNLRLVAAPPTAGYGSAQLEAEDYPALVPQGGTIDTVSAGMVLAAADHPSGDAHAADVAAFIDAFLAHLPALREPGHAPQWRDVEASAELPGWRRSPAAAAWLQANAPSAAAQPATELKEAFDRFLDDRMKKTGLPLTQAQKDALFAQFQRLQGDGPR